MNQDALQSPATTAAFSVDGMTCKSCVHHVSEILRDHFDGLTFKIALPTRRLSASWRPGTASAEAIAQVMTEAGYPVTVI